MRFAWILALALACAPALAHKPSDSYLALRAEGAVLEGQWDIALRDLEYAIGLDADGDGAITWGETRARHRLADTAAFLAWLDETADKLVAWRHTLHAAALQITARRTARRD